jgi:hypothetical protein
VAEDFEVGLVRFVAGPPRQVILIARSGDPRLVRIVRAFFAGTWPAAVPLATVPRIGHRRPSRGQRK